MSADESTPRPPLGPLSWPAWLGVGLLWAIGRLPAPVIAWLGTGLGALLYHLVPSRRRVVALNLALCFPKLPEPAREHLARAHFRALGRGALDIGLFWWARPARLRRLITFENREVYDQLLASQTPVLLVVPHYVSIMASVVLAPERAMGNVFRPLANPVWNYLYCNRLPRFGGTLIARDNIRLAVRVLRRGEPTTYFPDQDFGRSHAVFVPFCGVPAATTTALSRLLKLSHATALPLQALQMPAGRYRLIFGQPLLDAADPDPERAARALNAMVEETIRRAPAQYFWAHKRFKTRPDPAEDWYRHPPEGVPLDPPA